MTKEKLIAQAISEIIAMRGFTDETKVLDAILALCNEVLDD